MISTDAADRATYHQWFLSSNQLFLGGEPGMPARVQYGCACDLLISELDILIQTGVGISTNQSFKS